jgi:hypothetical protein
MEVRWVMGDRRVETGRSKRSVVEVESAWTALVRLLGVTATAGICEDEE